MRKIVLQEFVSVDGLAADAKGSVDFVPAAAEVLLIVCPVVLGAGKSLFREQDPCDFTLAESRSFDGGTVLLSYRGADV